LNSIEIKTGPIKSCTVGVPGSKSFSHRMLMAAALSNGGCTVENCLKSDDTRFTIKALEQLGVQIEDGRQRLSIEGKNGRFDATGEPVFLGNSGTSMRLLTALAALGKGTYVLTGSERMQERPLDDLLDGLGQIHVPVQSLKGNGCPPVAVTGGAVVGGNMRLRCGTSSQYLSAILLIAPCTRRGVEIEVIEGPVSKPYIDMTIHVMEQFGILVERSGYTYFKVAGGQTFQPGRYLVEPDCSQAGYFWAAAAVTGTGVKVQGITLNSLQGDIRLLRLFEAMGCRVQQEEDGLRLTGGALKAIDADMSDMPDMVPTLAVVSAFARGTTRISNVAHLRVKESDRLASVADGLTRMGISANRTDDGLVVEGGQPHGAEIDTYDDHRIAMSFAVAGLVTPGVIIRDERCVEKSFPDFWHVFSKL
jgi:3-phosphoshikimate 1-carboxyvinyltransferase